MNEAVQPPQSATPTDDVDAVLVAIVEFSSNFAASTQLFQLFMGIKKKCLFHGT